MAGEQNSNIGTMQPIIRGVQSVGAVQFLYRYNFQDTDGNYKLPIPSSIKLATDASVKHIDCGAGNGIPVAGFRLDSEFLRANPQIASSFVIPILGGGGVALTNNNRTGTLNLVSTRVAAPDIGISEEADAGRMVGASSGSNGLGVLDTGNYWDFVTIAQCQQGQEGGDSFGAQLTIKFKFCNVLVTVVFEGCTIATVDPLGLAGNDAVNYAVAVNYLNWTIDFTKEA